MVSVLLKGAPAFNRRMVALLESSRWGSRMPKNLAVITYVGRRSGKTVRTPIGYTRRGDELTILVVAPDEKSWWRNFTGEGAPLTIGLDGAQRSAHAVAERQSADRVAVTVSLSGGDDAP